MMQQVQTARPAQPAKTLKPPRPPLGLTRAQTRCLDAIREAIAFHIEGMHEDGLPIPVAASQVEYIEVAA